MKKLIVIGIVILCLGLAVYFLLPPLLSAAGLHPVYADRVDYRFDSESVLIVTTSHDRLGEGDDAKSTGVYASELFIPYYEFIDAGLAVDIASIAGEPVPIDPGSLKWPVMTAADKRYLKDDLCRQKVGHSLPVDDVDFTAYNMIYIAGGWGAAYDLGLSDALVEGISAAYAHGAVIGTVCHGSLGLLHAVTPDGEPLVRGRHVTGVTNKQVKELGIEITPMHPETELTNAGADYSSATAGRDIFANHVIKDGQLITGQNQNAGMEVAQRMMAQLMLKQEE